MLRHGGYVKNTGSDNPRVENPTAIESPFVVVPPTDLVGGDGGNGDCGRFTAELAAYVDDALTTDQRVALEAHVDNCPACKHHLTSIQKIDTFIQREWRENAPLPSSSEFQRSVASIMSALPPVPATVPAFAPRRVHAQLRWIRFSTGIAGVITILGLMWSSYRLGYAHGRSSFQPTPPAPQTPHHPAHHALPALFPGLQTGSNTSPTLTHTLTYSQR